MSSRRAEYSHLDPTVANTSNDKTIRRFFLQETLNLVTGLSILNTVNRVRTRSKEGDLVYSLSDFIVVPEAPTGLRVIVFFLVNVRFSAFYNLTEKCAPFMLHGLQLLPTLRERVGV